MNVGFRSAMISNTLVIGCLRINTIFEKHSLLYLPFHLLSSLLYSLFPSLFCLPFSVLSSLLYSLFPSLLSLPFSILSSLVGTQYDVTTTEICQLVELQVRNNKGVAIIKGGRG